MIFTTILINFRFAVTPTCSIAKVKNQESESVMHKPFFQPKILSSCAVEAVHTNAAIFQSVKKKIQALISKLVQLVTVMSTVSALYFLNTLP